MEKLTYEGLSTKIEVYTREQVSEGINYLILGFKRPDFAPLAEVYIEPQEVPSLLDGLEKLVLRLKQQDRRKLGFLDILAEDARKEIDAELMADLRKSINLEESIDEFCNEDHIKTTHHYIHGIWVQGNNND